jgi:hypothetical protein
MGPMWDLDLGFGNVGYSIVEGIETSFLPQVCACTSVRARASWWQHVTTCAGLALRAEPAVAVPRRDRMVRAGVVLSGTHGTQGLGTKVALTRGSPACTVWFVCAAPFGPLVLLAVRDQVGAKLTKACTRDAPRYNLAARVGRWQVGAAAAREVVHCEPP